MRLRPPAALLAALALAAGCGGPKVDPPARTSVSPASDPEQVRAAGVSILFVGNSHTGMHDMPALVADAVRTLRPGTVVATHYVPTPFLDDVAESPALLAEIDTRPWTHVVLQAQRISVSGKFDYSRQAGLDLAARAKGRGAAVVFYPEWGLKDVAGDGPRQEKVYREMARDAGVGVAPVARAWDIALAGRPDLPLHSPDGNHQSAVGAYLTACVLAATITGDSPAALAAWLYPPVDPADRKYLADSAARAVAEPPPPPK